MRALLLGLLGCGGRSDVELYREALATAPTYEAARAACDAIGEADSRGDCQMAVMERFERLQWADCETVERGLWVDECYFQMAERQRASGDLAGALRICENIRFARFCVWHLLQDEVEASLDEAPAVAEARLLPFVGSRALPDAAVQLWVIRFREAAGHGRVLDEADCATLQAPEPCQRAVNAHVRTILDSVSRSQRERLCAQELGKRAFVGTSPAWRLGPLTTAAESRWVFERCGAEAPAPPPQGEAVGGRPRSELR